MLIFNGLCKLGLLTGGVGYFVELGEGVIIKGVWGGSYLGARGTRASAGDCLDYRRLGVRYVNKKIINIFE